MSTSFPTALDSFLNPAGIDALANATPGLQHHVQHDNSNDAVSVMQAKIGIDGSAVTTSLDYLVKSTSSLNPGHKHSSSSISDWSTYINQGVSTSDSPTFATGIFTSSAFIRHVSADKYTTGFSVYKRGTDGDANAAVATGTELGLNLFFGWDETDYWRGGFLLAVTTEDWTSIAHGTQFVVYVTANGSAGNVLAVVVDQDRSVKALGGYRSSDGTAGMSDTRIFNDGVVVNTVTIKNGLITAWTQV